MLKSVSCSLMKEIVLIVVYLESLQVKQLRPRSTGDNLPRDSFVKLFLLPNEKHSYQTKVRHRSNHPVFNESFSFHVKQEFFFCRLHEQRQKSRAVLSIHIQSLFYYTSIRKEQ